MKSEYAAKCVDVFENVWVDWFEQYQVENIFVWSVPEFCLGYIHKTFIGRGNRLREFLSGWKGAPLSPNDFRNTELQSYVGRTCMLSIDHAEDWVHATVTGAAPRDSKLPMPERNCWPPESFYAAHDELYSRESQEKRREFAKRLRIAEQSGVGIREILDEYSINEQLHELFQLSEARYGAGHR